MDLQIRNLRKLNLLAGCLHLVSFIAILFLANDGSLPVVATYLTEAPGTGNFSDPINLFNLNISYMVAVFMALSAAFHFYVCSPSAFKKYIDGLSRSINKYRWIEYSMSSTIMIIIILQLNGTSDYIALLGIGGINVCMILFGWLQERYTTPGDGDILPFLFGCFAGAIPWIAIALNVISPKGPAESTVPGFVYGIIISLFILFNCFAIIQWKQYQARGKWAEYSYGERRYIILSFIAKSLLAWQVFAGSLAS
jgi:hypothetical protein